MTERRIGSADAVWDEIRTLYQAAFPPEERIPYGDLIRLADEMPLDVTAYHEDGEFVGFTVVRPRGAFVWFWYFAVREELRGRGIGQEILASLIARYEGRTCILDMESPRQPCANSEQRRRRRAFYLRNGFADTDAYRTFDGIEYTVMIRGEGTFTARDYDRIIEDLRRFWKPEGD